MANKKYKLTDGNMWATDGIHDFGQNKTQRTINSEVNTALGGKAPTNHASTSTTYGKGTSSNYGHVKISDSLTDTTPAATGGVVPSMKAVSDLNGAITSLATVVSVSQLSDLSGSSSHFVNFGANVTVGAYDIPRYSKGILVASSASDAVLIAVSAIGTIYTAYRNGGTWTKTDLKSYAPVVRSTPVAIPSSSATYTLDGVTGYYHLVSWGFQSSSGNPIPENKAPCDLTWSTANGTFTITKTDDRPLSGQKICPIFEYALDKQAT